MIIAATSISIENKAVLLTGPSGVGKSDVALRLIDSGACLISDDQTELSLENGTLTARPAPRIAGLIEIRHVGIFRVPFVKSAPVALHIELVNEKVTLSRLPETRFQLWLDQNVRSFTLPGYASSTPAKIRAILSLPCDETQ